MTQMSGREIQSTCKCAGGIGSPKSSQCLGQGPPPHPSLCSCRCLPPLSTAPCSCQKPLVLPSPSILPAVSHETLHMWPCPGLDHLAGTWRVFGRLLTLSSCLLTKPRVTLPSQSLLPVPGFTHSLVPASGAGSGGKCIVQGGWRALSLPHLDC